MEKMSKKNMTMDMSSMDMVMTFNNKLPFSLLFDDIRLDSKTDLAVACILLLFLGVLYEFLKFLRLKLLDPNCGVGPCCPCYKKTRRESNSSHTFDFELSSEKKSFNSTTDSTDDVDNDAVSFQKGHEILKHVAETAFHALQLFVSYLIMLAVMTYNVYIVLCIIVGCTFGYFVFQWPRGGRRKRKRGRPNLMHQTGCH